MYIVTKAFFDGLYFKSGSSNSKLFTTYLIASEYLEWAYAYCKGVQFVINDDNTLTVADSDIHILFDYIWKIITWEGKELC